MSATQLCVFDDKTDSKSKLVKKAQCNMVVLSGLSRLFCEDFNLMFCCNLMTIHANWMCQTLTQGIEKIKTFTKYKKCSADKFIFTKNTRGAVECWDHSDEIKTVKNQTYPASTTHILPKFSDLLFRFCYVQTA